MRVLANAGGAGRGRGRSGLADAGQRLLRFRCHGHVDGLDLFVSQDMA